MKIDQKHIPFRDFITNEVQTLNRLRGYSAFRNLGSDMNDVCEKVYNQHITFHNKKMFPEFSFGCKFILTVEKTERLVLLEAHIKPEFEIASYCLSICKNNSDPYELIRKFHFDYAPGILNQSPKPIYHLQYGGKPTPKIKEMKLENDEIQPWLSSPRINSTPINLALVIDFLLCEFSSLETKKITEVTEWRNMIKSNEDQLLKNYYLNISEFFRRNHKSNNLFREFYYGKG